MKFYIIAIFAAFLTAFCQLLLKLGANHYKKTNIFKFYLNKYVVSGYIIFIAVTLMNLYAYKEIDLKSYVFIYPFTIITLLFFSRYILKERIDRNAFKGIIIVIIGMIIFNL